ncbi:unnamed protein product [Cunninghamella blakesleeana]
MVPTTLVEEKPIFELVLVKIEDASYNRITCVKKNMYDESLKYIALSYRWGELTEQLVETPDYVAHITSFDKDHLIRLCQHIQREPDLQHIPYLWVDTISVDQSNHERKKETIRQMSSIYIKANYIVAVPDLNFKHLMLNPANEYFILLTYKYSEQIYKSFFRPDNQLRYIDEGEEKNLKLAYKFLHYLVDAWAQRAWVISEYNLAREKNEQHGTPLKLMFVTLFPESPGAGYFTYFITHYFQHPTSSSSSSLPPPSSSLMQINDNPFENTTLYSTYKNNFLAFLEKKLNKRMFLDRLLNSMATKDEDRFYAILPSWKNYHAVVKDKNTISEWNLTTMVSIRLKVFEIVDDLWEKARLLYACSKSKIPAFPTFADGYSRDFIVIRELDDPELAHRLCSSSLLSAILKMNGNKMDDEYKNIKKMTSGSLLIENLKDITLNGQCLTMKANNYFIIDQVDKTDEMISKFGFTMADNLKYAYIPYFICSIPKYKHILTIYKTGVYLLGDMDKNRWAVFGLRAPFADNPVLYSDDYTFNIY